MTIQTIDQILAGLDDLRIEAEVISGMWDGDAPGTAEDRAHAADELTDKIDDIKDLIAELDL